MIPSFAQTIKDKADKILHDDFSELRKIYPDKSGLFDRTEKVLWGNINI
jgi:hypothetical protein